VENLGGKALDLPLLPPLKVFPAARMVETTDFPRHSLNPGIANEEGNFLTFYHLGRRTLCSSTKQPSPHPSGSQSCKGLRHPALSNWQEMATANLGKVAEWANNGYADFNCVCVAKQEGTGILDIDDLAACKAAGMPTVPQTFTVKSPKGYLVHFLHTDASRALGNRDVKVDGAKILEVKCHNTAVAAPGWDLPPDSPKPS
jgi:hypothetical protein